MKQQSAEYDLKPFVAESVHKSLAQYAGTHAQKTMTEPDISMLVPASRAPQSPKMAIKANGKILFIDPTELVAVHAEGNYVLLEKEFGSYRLRATISEMIGKLERYGFIRIHRSVLVNASFVEEMESYPTGNYGLRIRGGKVYTVSRTYKKNLHSLADSWVGSDAFLRK